MTREQYAAWVKETSDQWTAALTIKLHADGALPPDQMVTWDDAPLLP